MLHLDRDPMPTPSPLDDVRRSLAADRDTLRAAVDRVPPDRRGEHPLAGRWSVAEVLEHLAIVERRIAASLPAFLADAPRDGAPSAATPLGRDVLRDRTRPITSPPPIHPTGTLGADEAWAALEQSRADVLAALDAAEGRDLTKISRQHPVLGTVDGYQWITFLGAHEERHALQIQEIADALDALGARRERA